MPDQQKDRWRIRGAEVVRVCGLSNLKSHGISSSAYLSSVLPLRRFDHARCEGSGEHLNTLQSPKACTGIDRAHEGASTILVAIPVSRLHS